MYPRSRTAATQVHRVSFSRPYSRFVSFSSGLEKRERNFDLPARVSLCGHLAIIRPSRPPCLFTLLYLSARSF